MTPAQRMDRALNRLAKWRTVLVGWMLGTLPNDAPGIAAYRDLQEARLLMRAELNGLTALLIAKGLCTQTEIETAFADEAEQLEQALQRKFPGYRATDAGIDVNVEIARETCRVLGFPA